MRRHRDRAVFALAVNMDPDVRETVEITLKEKGLPARRRRVGGCHCIGWRHDSDQWTARVGSHLKGVRYSGKLRNARGQAA